MGEATKGFMRMRPTGATSGNMIWELKKNPEFKAIIEKNKTHPYNVFKRLVTQGELVKRGDRYYSPEFIKVAPPDASSEGASNSSGEGGSSPSESPSGAVRSTVG